jgi:SnoaL-like domain
VGVASEDDMTLEETVDLYCSAWSEPDREKRLAVLREVLTPEATYIDPRTDVKGHEALAAHIEQVLAARPGARIARTSVVDAHHDRARFAWHLVQSDGTTLPGIDIVEIDLASGKLRSILGFFGPLVKLG